MSSRGEAVTLPDVNIDDIHNDTKKLLAWNNNLLNYWEAFPYFLEAKTSKKRQSMHIAKFSDRKKNDFTRDSLEQVLMFKDFPQELVQGESKRASRRKKFQWNPESEPQIDTSTTSSAAFTITTIYYHHNCEHCHNLCHYTNAIIVVITSANPISIASTTGKEENDENEKKDGEDGDEDENAQEEDEEDINDDDYNQNIDFDDDEDDYNDVDDGDDEPTYQIICMENVLLLIP
ncbi:hypothetical protein JHK82_037108 [Glycine max]|nr:hypothetical protein JHK82_037108 [Glycine max]KAG5131116.1 hypothetical protein JHK84_037513 [Glycine max]